MEASSGGHIVPKIMTFRPTMDEFKDFSRYIEYIEDNGGHRAGICKVIPPKEWTPRRSKNYDDIDLVIPAPIQQMITGCQGLYQQYNIQRKPIHVTDFKKLANSDRHHEPVHSNMEELERKYWKNITFINPLYGADTSGSLTDPDQPYWNINHLGTILDCVNEDYGVKIEGVNTAYLYFGMWKTTFGWHTEDMDLYSINYLHFGAPKTWYSVPPEHGRRLERLAAGFFPSTAQTCAGFMRHKMTVISPSVLRKYSIPYDKIVHYPGEFMITFPYGYHAGFNNGYNCAESTNFATKRWIEYGKRCVLCNCSRDMVRISMDCFVKRYQPDKYKLWKEGKDLAPHPEDDQSKLYPHSGRGAAQAKTDLLELGIIGAEPEPRKRKVKAIDTGVVSKKRHPLSQQFGDIPTALLKEDSAVTKPAMTAKGKHRKSTIAAQETKVPNKTGAQNDKAMQDAVIAKIMASINEQITKKNDSNATGDSAKGAAPQQSPGMMNVARTLLQPTGSVHTVTTLTSTSGSGVNCSPTQTDTRLVVTSMVAAPSGGVLKNCSVVSQGNVTAVSLLRPTVAPPCTIVSATGIAQQNGVQTVIANPAQLIAASGGQLHLIGNQLVCLAPTTTVATSSLSSQPTKNLSGVVGTPVQHQPLQFSVMSQQVAPPTAMAAVAMTTSSAPFLSSVSSVESGQTSSTDVVTDSIELTEVVVGGENTDPPPMSLDDMLTSDEYDVPMYSETMPADMDSMSATALEHAYFSSRSDVMPSQTPSQPVTPDTEATKKTCKRKEKTTKSGVPAKAGRDKAATKEVGKQSPKEDPKAKRIAELEELMADKRLESWMLDMKRLFQVWPHDMDVERTYNETCAEVEPYCSMCQLFRQTRPEPLFSSDSDDSSGPGHCEPVNKAGKAQCSQPLIPNSCFITSIDNQNPRGRNSSADLPGGSTLLTCTECKICVHASCYGVEEDAGTDWTCDRCNKHQPLAECCLCMLRGGALKPTTDGQWAHLVCALSIPEVVFEDVARRGPVNVDKVPAARKKLRCVHCQHIVLEHAGACAQCSTGRCTTAFHVTCAHAAGASFEFNDWPFPVYISCLKHCNSRSQPKHRSLPPVSHGDTVIAKHKNGRFYKCQVIDTQVQVFYEVDFADGSFSHDLFPEDIVNFECLEAGPPPRGQAVQVRWPDGVLYDATFRGTNSQDMYTVEFEDGSEITLKRENIWLEQEELPKRVKSRISLATEMKHDIFNDENVSNKRVRRSTVKYSRD